MHVANLALSNLSNIGTGLSEGLRSLGHDAHSLVLEPDAYGTDIELMWSRDPGACRAALDRSEVLHLNSLLVGFTLMLTRPPVRLSRLAKGRRLVLQYHGGDLRRAMHPSVKALIAKHRLRVLVTVPDLIAHMPGADWLPIPVRAGAPEFRPANPPASPFRVCHAPTTRAVKKTDAFLEAVGRLRKKYDVEAVVIENRPYDECLEIKRSCHVNFDNIGYGSYALASIESMLMEQPSLVYLNELSRVAVGKESARVGIECPLIPVGDAAQPTDGELRARLEGKAPSTFTERDVESIYRALEGLILDEGRRKELGQRGRRWATEVHDERRVAERASRVYETTPPFGGFGAGDRGSQLWWWGLTTARNVLTGKVGS